MTKPKPTDDNTPAPDGIKRAVAKIDFTKPFAVIVHQTETRNNFEIIEGDDCMTVAAEKAAVIAMNQMRPVAVFGPQVKVKVPPVKPMADDLPLAF